jgi:error-prone DNA polymerase
LGTNSEYQERLSQELDVISQLGFAGYFLTVGEVVDLTKQMGIRVAARGSGAGSLVNFTLGISGLDPVKYGLLMERFLSPLRSALPDIDIDVESDRRLDIYDAIYERFGKDRVVCISMRETYRVRHAVRDVGAALGLPPGEIDAFAKTFPRVSARRAREVLSQLPELRKSSFSRLMSEGNLDLYLDLVEKLDGLPRHLAMHPCGVILSDKTLLDRTPVEQSGAKFPMSQFDKDDVELMGFLKLDVLGIRMQSAMAYSLQEIKRVDKVDINLDEISLEDEKTFKLIQSTKTLGCFQIESPGTKRANWQIWATKL